MYKYHIVDQVTSGDVTLHSTKHVLHSCFVLSIFQTSWNIFQPIVPRQKCHTFIWGNLLLYNRTQVHITKVTCSCRTILYNACCSTTPLNETWPKYPQSRRPLINRPDILTWLQRINHGKLNGDLTGLFSSFAYCICIWLINVFSGCKTITCLFIPKIYFFK